MLENVVHLKIIFSAHNWKLGRNPKNDSLPFGSAGDGIPEGGGGEGIGVRSPPPPPLNPPLIYIPTFLSSSSSNVFKLLFFFCFQSQTNKKLSPNELMDSSFSSDHNTIAQTPSTPPFEKSLFATQQLLFLNCSKEICSMTNCL